MLASFNQGVSESTAHGISRITSGNKIHVRILWIFLFLGGVGLFWLHFWQLISQLRNKQTSASIILNAIPFKNPDIHFCNKLPFSHSYTVNPDAVNKPWMDKFQSLKEPLDAYFSQLDVYQFWEILWQTFPNDLLFKAFGARAYQNFINILTTADEEAFSNIDIKSMPHWRHFSCFRLRPGSSDFQNPDSQMTIYLFSDSLIRSPSNFSVGQSVLDYMNFFGVSIADISSGITIYFTPRGQYPTADTPKVVATPGFKTTVTLSMVRQNLINKSTAPCTNEEINATYVDILRGPPATVTYNQAGFQSCLNEEFHRLTVKKCGCYTHYTPMTLDFYRAGNLACFNFTELLVEYNYNLTRVDEVMKWRKRCIGEAITMGTPSFTKCYPKTPCCQEFYKLEKTKSGYALSDSLEDMLGSTYQVRTYNYNLSVPGWKAFYPKRDKTKLHEPAETFAKVIIQSSETTSTLISEKRIYVLWNLLSDMGGILGFYMGISVLTICELFEVLLYLIDRCFLANNDKDSNKEPPSVSNELA